MVGILCSLWTVKMPLITLPLYLSSDGTQHPFLVELYNPNTSHVVSAKALVSNAEPACWLGSRYLRDLCLFPSGIDLVGSIRWQRYHVNVVVTMEDDRKVRLDRLRVYRHLDDDYCCLAFGAKVASASMQIPPIDLG